MTWNLMFFINSMLLGVGLAMDAFNVSLANGLAEPNMRKKRMSLIAGVFAFFQAAMPLLGWICVHTIVRWFGAFEKVIPWIALILLSWIGINMIRGSLKKKNGGEAEEEKACGVTGRMLILQGIATSIDALSVGFTIAGYGWIMALVCAIIIAAVTYVISMSGLLLGRRFGMKLAGKAGILGGCILIFIGVEIFVSSFI